MRSICSIILLISLSTTSAGEKGPDAVIWYDGSTFYKQLDKDKSATIYFSNWEQRVQQFVNDENYRVAMQLDNQLNPSPDQKLSLPSLRHLSAISDQTLVEEYLDFLENYSRTIGFNQLVLPDTVNLTHYEKEVIQVAIQHSPFFFLPKSYVSEDLPRSKKEIQTDHPVVWVSTQTVNSKRLNRWSRSVQRNFDQKFYDGIKTERSFAPTYLLTEQLAQRIFEEASVAIDDKGQLPIRSKAIVYKGSDDKLKNTLKKYVTVYDRFQPEELPIIVDRRAGFDGELLGNEILIAYSISSDSELVNTSLFVPGQHKDDDIIIAKMLFGALEISGQSEQSRTIDLPGFVGYSTAEFEGLNDRLEYVKDVAKAGIEKYATPGCQVAVMKNGSIVYEKSYGYFTYDSLKAVENSTFYDLASVTKVIATLPAIALLVDQGKIQLDDSIGKHLPGFSNSNKSHVTIKQLLAHNGGIRSYIPFWRRTMKGDRLNSFYYKTKEDEEKDIRSYNFEYHPSMRDSLRSWITKSDLIKHPEKYNYSDLGFMILHMLVEAVAQQPFDQFLQENFYEPMGLNIGFNPRTKGLSLEQIAPTEYDHLFRDDQVWGEVHDRNAHIFGGVAGHAGLFSNASDLAKMMYMLSNGGYYSGRQYLKEETINLFNSRYFRNNRRGLGWDKKDWRKDSASDYASNSSFGHTGFTGTMVWSDPEEDLIYVFLSNRIYPDSKNEKLMDLNIRSEIHDVIYTSIINE